MKVVIRSIKNVLRNPVRMVLVVTLLGASLMFVAAMISLSTNSQRELTAVHQLVGTTITINYVTNNASSEQQGIPGGSTPGFFGGPPKPIADSIVAEVKRVPGVVSTQETLMRADMDGVLQGSVFTAPNGQDINAPLGVHGLAPDDTTVGLLGGSTPTLVAGRAFHASEAHADVAMMSEAVAQINHLQVGSTFTLNGTTFTLVGLYTTSNQLADSTIIIPMATMEQVFQTHGVGAITATASSYEQVETVAARLRTVLGKQFDVVTQTAQYRDVFSALQVAQKSIQVALVVSFGIAAAVTIFTVLMLVRERTAEIAILKTIGASHMQVLRQFWAELLVLSATAVVLALLLLATFGPVIAQTFDIDPSSLVKASTANPTTFFTATVDGPGPTASSAANPLSGVHLAPATLNVQTLLIVVGVGMGLALLTNLIPTWFVVSTKPAQVLRRPN